MKEKQLFNTEEKLRMLEAESEIHKKAIAKEMSTVTGDLKSIGTVLLVAGGAFALTYLVGKSLSSGKKEKTKTKEDGHVSAEVTFKEPKQESEIVRMIKEQIAIFLVAIIKEKIMDFIKSMEEKK